MKSFFLKAPYSYCIKDELSQRNSLWDGVTAKNFNIERQSSDLLRWVFMKMFQTISFRYGSSNSKRTITSTPESGSGSLNI